jgi:hypothetical protein
MKGYMRLLVAALVLASVLAPAGAHAAGTGDDPTPTTDIPTAATYAAEAAYRKLVADVGTLGSDIPYKYYYTPTHLQERAYWCGPASVQIIDDYWGAAASQGTIADWLGTTSRGTDFSLVDNAITHFSGVSYVYYGPCSSTYDVLNRIQYGLLDRGHPAVGDFNVPSSWPNYIYSHAGHIIPIEAFDWRYMTVRLNDPYNERDWISGGGSTSGHRTYSSSQIAAGIYNHWRRAIVY